MSASSQRLLLPELPHYARYIRRLQSIPTEIRKYLSGKNWCKYYWKLQQIRHLFIWTDTLNKSYSLITIHQSQD